MRINYPIFILTDREGNPNVSVMDGRQCFVAYQSKEVAELYLEQSGADLIPWEFDQERLFDLCASIPSVPFLIWNSLETPGTMIFIPTEEFRR